VEKNDFGSDVFSSSDQKNMFVGFQHVPVCWNYWVSRIFCL